MQMGFVTNRIKGVLNENQDEKKLVDGLRKGDPRIINYIYKRNMPVIRNMANQFTNIMLEAEDLMQEGITRTLMNVRAGKFNGQSSIHTYLYGICRNICLKESEKVKRMSEYLPLVDYNSEDENYFELLKTVLEIKNRLDKKCLEIIDIRFKLIERVNDQEEKSKLLPFENIAEVLGIEADNARQRFSRCLKKLIDEVNSALKFQ
jgi:RNA polymerase sigma factor (sigma-70 family)